MDEILKLNRKNFIKIYLWCSGILSSIFLVFLFYHQEISTKWIVIMLFITSIVCPLLFLFGFAFNWRNKRKIIKKIISEKPYSELDKIGFNKKTLSNDFSCLNDYVQFAEINGMQIILNVDIEKPNVVKFIINCNTFNLNRKKYLEKYDELKRKNIEINFYSLTKKIDTRKEKISIQNLEVILNDLTQIVEMNKFEPILITEWENY